MGVENQAGAGHAVTAANIDPYLGRGGGTTANVLCPSDTSKSFATSYSLTPVAAAPTCLIDAANHKL